MTKARTLLENMNRHFGNKYKVNEEEIEKEDDKKIEDETEIKEEDEVEAEKKEDDEEIKEEDEVEAPVTTDVAGIIEKLISENFSADNDSQLGAVKMLEELAKSDAPEANAFMEALDQCTSAMAVQAPSEVPNEDADAEALVVFNPEKWAHLGEAKKALIEAKKKDLKKKDKKKTK